jgi:hypothetical protein
MTPAGAPVAGADAACQWCGLRSYGTGSHPCCEAWCGRRGRRSCPACEESRRAARQHFDREPPGNRSGGVDPELWDWDSIIRAEAQAAERTASFPKCRICGGHLACGQVGAHFSCDPDSTPADAGQSR